jgi:hypothetical protein
LGPPPTDREAHPLAMAQFQPLNRAARRSS